MSMKEWHVEVRMFFDGDLTVEREDDFAQALDQLDSCNSITQQPDGWVIFIFTLDSTSATGAASVASQQVATVWENWFVPRLALVPDMEVRAVEYQRWLEKIGPDGKIRAWSEFDDSPNTGE